MFLTKMSTSKTNSSCTCINNPHGQTYTPEDRGVVSYYKEATSGQVLQEGINELGEVYPYVNLG